MHGRDMHLLQDDASMGGAWPGVHGAGQSLPSHTHYHLTPLPTPRHPYFHHKQEKRALELERMKAKAESACKKLEKDVVAIKQQKVGGEVGGRCWDGQGGPARSWRRTDVLAIKQ